MGHSYRKERGMSGLRIENKSGPAEPPADKRGWETWHWQSQDPAPEMESLVLIKPGGSRRKIGYRAGGPGPSGNWFDIDGHALQTGLWWRLPSRANDNRDILSRVGLLDSLLTAKKTARHPDPVPAAEPVRAEQKPSLDEARYELLGKLVGLMSEGQALLKSGQAFLEKIAEHIIGKGA